MSERLTLPVLPLLDMVLFPGVTTPVGAGRPATLRAIEAALKTESRLIFAVAQRENVDSVSPALLYGMGTIARIGQVQRGLGGVQLVLHGEKRAAALQYAERAGHIEAVVVEAVEQPPIKPDDRAFVALFREARERAGELGEKSGLPDEVVRQVLEEVADKPGRLADLVAGYLDIATSERQGLLELLSVEERLRRVLVHVQRQIGVLNAQEDIKSQVQEELGQRQREMILREQLKAIHKELGEEDEGGDVEELRKRLAALGLPEAAKKEVERELSRLERASRDSMEAQVIRTYLETVAELPWNKRADESLDLKRAAEILEEDHYGLKDVKDQVLEFLAVRQLRQRAPKGEAPGNEDDKQAKGLILLFLGPPGVGKTSIAKSIAGPLLDRMEKVEFAGYTEREKLEIAKRYLVPRQLREKGLSPEQLTIADEAVSAIIASYTREAGVRQLEREIGKLARKVARRIAAGEVERVTVAAADVDDLLGRPTVHPERKAREDQVGVATGMYYTPVGGDIMFVEASVMRGKGELVLTGQLGDVMKESARAALTYAKSHADRLGIPEDILAESDLHIHVPAGAIPKDGPSAGVTMATALVSALSKRPARHDIAMTGEVTLRGRVLPIGGVKEKVLGAVRAGIKTIILPKENEADLQDLPEDVRKWLDVHVAEELGEVLSLALRGARFEEGHLVFEGEAPVEPSLVSKN